MNKFILALLAVSVISVTAEITQDQIDANVCNCKDHPFLPKIKAFLESIQVQADTDVVAALAKFGEATAANDVEIDDTVKALAHLKGERSCCSDLYVVGIKAVVKAIFKNTEEKPPVLARVLFGLPRICGVSGEGKPATIKEFLAQYKTDEITGPEILKRLAQARIALGVNHARSIRGYLTALCISPCRAGDFLDGDAVLVNKEADDANKVDFEAAKKILDDLKPHLEKVIDFFTNKFGNDDCKAKVTKIKEVIKTGDEVKRPEKLGGKQPGTATDDEAEAKGKDAGVKKEDRSPRVKPDGKEKPRNEETEKKIKEKKEEIEKKRTEKKAELKKKAEDRPKVDVAAVKKQLEEAKNADCQVKGCYKCSNPATCDKCIDGLFAVFNGETDLLQCRPGGEAACKQVGGTFTKATDAASAKCVLSGTVSCTQTVPGCLTCDTDNKTCKTCIDGAVLTTEKTCAKKCVKNDICTECDTTSAWKCKTCATGLEVNTRGECIKKATCTKNTVCTACTDDNSACKTCANTHTLVTGKCLPKCSDGKLGCKTCSTKQGEDYKCATCADGHELVNATFCKPLRPKRRMLAEAETKVVENGGINTNVKDDDDSELVVDDVTAEGCVNADDCKEPTSPYANDQPVAGNDGSSGSDANNGTILSVALSIIFMIIIA